MACRRAEVDWDPMQRSSTLAAPRRRPTAVQDCGSLLQARRQRQQSNKLRRRTACSELRCLVSYKIAPRPQLSPLDPRCPSPRTPLTLSVRFGQVPCCSAPHAHTTTTHLLSPPPPQPYPLPGLLCSSCPCRPESALLLPSPAALLPFIICFGPALLALYRERAARTPPPITASQRAPPPCCFTSSRVVDHCQTPRLSATHLLLLPACVPE
jgi:hypothetical protein